MSDSPYLSIVVPAYNEARRLPPTLTALVEFFRGFTRTYEVLIVVEQSTDGTLEIAAKQVAQQAHFQVVDNGPKRGKGHAVRSGMQRARGEIVFYMDADLSVPLAEVPAFLRHFEQTPKVDVLIGNRQHAMSRITRRQSPLREGMGKIFNRVLQTLALVDLRDTQCGFKAFRQAACREIFTRQKVEGFAFDVEVLLLAERLGYGVEDLPVEWINSPESKVEIVADSLRMLRDAWQIQRRLRHMRPELSPPPEVVPAKGPDAVRENG
ncbi:MAG: dolichyl-phosphate beta-glucosyltransferase [Chthoniobacter sp.]|uniref:dolichyl-phosphate beta-glucosyltransferase n=1 Tax=Chthoniobacter sp. TaxID=2510640 RepID=UPI0032AAB5B8